MALDQSVNNYLRSNLNKLFTKLVYTLTKHGHGDGFESFAGPYCLGSIFLVTSGLITAATSQYQTTLQVVLATKLLFLN